MRAPIETKRQLFVGRVVLNISSIQIGRRVLRACVIIVVGKGDNLISFFALVGKKIYFLPTLHNIEAAIAISL